MNNTYQYKLILQTNENTEWLESKADSVSLFDDDIGVRTIELTFNTFALEGQLFQELLGEINQAFGSYAMLVIGENVGHIEVLKKNMPVTLEVAMVLNGQEYRNVWEENITDED